MTWTNEVIAAFILLALAVVGLLQRFGILKLPFSRNNNPKPSNCDKRHDKIDHDLQTIKEGQTRRRTQIADMKDRLDKKEIWVDENFKAVQANIATINTNVAVIKERIEQQYGFMTDSMRFIIEKINKVQS